MTATLLSLLLVNQIPALGAMLSLEALSSVDWVLVAMTLMVTTVLSNRLARALNT